jgi:hypothetical protein
MLEPERSNLRQRSGPVYIGKRVGKRGVYQPKRKILAKITCMAQNKAPYRIEKVFNAEIPSDSLSIYPKIFLFALGAQLKCSVFEFDAKV